MTTEKLKPCPFCGSNNIDTRFTTSTYVGKFMIICCTCQTTQSRQIRLEDADFENLTDSMNKAIETWNTRFKADNKATLSINGAELPCKVGDTVYYIANANSKDIVRDATIKKMSIYSDGSTGYDCGFGKIRFTHSLIGKQVFLTKMEAEQALKESEKIGNL